jgi:hypothetical protein
MPSTSGRQALFAWDFASPSFSEHIPRSLYFEEATMGSHPWLADSCKRIIPDAIILSSETAQKSTKMLVQEQLLQDKVRNAQSMK